NPERPFTFSDKLNVHETPPTEDCLTPSGSNVSISSPLSASVSDTSVSHRSSEFEVSVLNCLASIKENIDQHSIILNEVIRSIRATNQPSSVAPKDLPNFPIKNLAELKKFDALLQENQELVRYMTSRLAAVGGSTIEYHTRRALKFLMSNEVAVNFNWKGREKLSFEKTKIMSVIYGKNSIL
ncbi:hypothetical protein AMK59_4867, partial [Oryctes borbonicus]